MKCFAVLLSFFIATAGMHAQKSDTVVIDASKVKTAFLKPGVNRYLVYFKMGKDSSRTRYQLWSRTINFVTYKGQPAVRITQEWEDNQAVVHKVYSVCDRKTFLPLYQQSWWQNRGSFSFDFVARTAAYNDTAFTATDTMAQKKKMFDAFQQSWDQYFLNWHLDLEVFSLLPYRQGVTFLINFYDPGFSAPAKQAYTVTGSAQLTGYDHQAVDCWLLQHEGGPGNREVFWVSKKTHEVLKLEQEFNGRFRYKVKLGFSV